MMVVYRERRRVKIVSVDGRNYRGAVLGHEGYLDVVKTTKIMAGAWVLASWRVYMYAIAVRYRGSGI